jgi:hypothetical protein
MQPSQVEVVDLADKQFRLAGPNCEVAAGATSGEDGCSMSALTDRSDHKLGWSLKSRDDHY